MAFGGDLMASGLSTICLLAIAFALLLDYCRSVNDRPAYLRTPNPLL